MALKIEGEYKNNEIGMGNGGIQPGSYTNDQKSMRLNNGAPSRNGTNDDVINYTNNNSTMEYDDNTHASIDRVVASSSGEGDQVTLTYVDARGKDSFSCFGLHSSASGTAIDNGTTLGDVTASGSFHYVGPQNSVSTDEATYEWDKNGVLTEVTESNKFKVESDRVSAINKIYMAGAVNAMSARN